MYLNLRTTLGFIALTAAVLLTWWLARSPAQRPAAVVDSETVPPGYYLKEARVIGTDNEGKVLYEITATTARQDALAETMHLQGVRIEYQPGAEVPWSLESETGMAPAGRSFIELSGDVRLQTLGRSERNTIVILTDALKLRPDDYTASTDAQVRIQMGGQYLNATGMVAYLNDDRLELKSNVNGLFRP